MERLGSSILPFHTNLSSPLPPVQTRCFLADACKAVNAHLLSFNIPSRSPPNHGGNLFSELQKWDFQRLRVERACDCLLTPDDLCARSPPNRHCKWVDASLDALSIINTSHDEVMDCAPWGELESVSGMTSHTGQCFASARKHSLPNNGTL